MTEYCNPHNIIRKICSVKCGIYDEDDRIDCVNKHPCFEVKTILEEPTIWIKDKMIFNGKNL